MKFTDGYWLGREQFLVQNPLEIYEVNNIKNSSQAELEAFATFKHITERGDTLNIGNTKINAFSPRKDIIGIKLTHFDVDDKNPQYDLITKKVDTKVDITPAKVDGQGVCLKQGNATLESGNLQLHLPIGGDFRMSFNWKSNNELVELTASEYKAQGVIEDLSTGQMHSLSVSGAQQNKTVKRPVHYMREQLNINYDTKIYGLGERFNSFIKNGQVVDIINKDGGTGSEQSYKNIPFYLAASADGLFYGVFVNESQPVSFEIASENADRVQFSTEGESLEYYVIAGKTPLEVLGKFNKLVGGSYLPPKWTFGLWLSTSFTTDYSEKTVLKFVDGMKERDIPLSVFHFDCFWMKGFQWSDFIWDKNAFPDPKALIEKLHKRGLKVCVWINPYIAQKSEMFKEGKQNDYFIKHKDGTVWQWDLWQAGNAFVDFTNPNAVKWYQSKLQKLLDIGVDCFKTDFGERIPIHDAVFFDNSNPKGAHNYYTHIYNKAVFELLQKEKGKDEAVLFARSATVGGAQFPVHWGGDNVSRYISMADSLRGGLSLLCSGFTFWSHDIGGFEENTPPHLYKRWTQFGLLSSHSRYHGNVQYRVPWLFDEEAVEVTRKFTKLKLELMDYIYNEAKVAVEKGYPLMRPIFTEFYNDPNTFNIDLQYMLGSKLIVCPIFNKDGKVRFYLPKGKWYRLKQVCGTDKNGVNLPEVINSNGEWLVEEHTFLTLPLFSTVKKL